jgi:hypothetical protein
MNDLCETDGLEADRIQIVSGFPGAFKKYDVFSEFESEIKSLFTTPTTRLWTQRTRQDVFISK